MNNQKLLKALKKAIKEGNITLHYSLIGCYNCDAEGATRLTSKDYRLDLLELATEVEKIKNEQQAQARQRKSEMLKDFNDADLRIEIKQREKKKTHGI